MAIFPNVPDVPGVPALLRPPGFVGALPRQLVQDLVPNFAGGASQWGVFLNGKPVVVADSVVAVDYKKESTVSDYPQQRGAFQSYNKVQVPFDIRVRFSSGGSIASRQALLKSIDAIADTLDLYDVVTPEVTYQSVNVKHDDYRRTADHGAGRITVELWLIQVRVTAVAAFTSTKTPSGADPVNNGTVQTTPPTPAQLGVPAAVN